MSDSNETKPKRGRRRKPAPADGSASTTAAASAAETDYSVERILWTTLRANGQVPPGVEYGDTKALVELYRSGQWTLPKVRRV